MKQIIDSVASSSSVESHKSHKRRKLTDSQQLIHLERQKLDIMKQQLDTEKKRLKAEKSLADKLDKIHNIISKWSMLPHPMPDPMPQSLPPFRETFSPQKNTPWDTPNNANLPVEPVQPVQPNSGPEIHHDLGCSYMKL